MSSEAVKYLDEFNLTSNQLEQLEKYYQVLVDYNEKVNLTRITEINEAYIKHFYDSLILSKLGVELENKKLVDVGTGAGFPGMVLKIQNPKLDVTLLEPSNKRVTFLNKVINELNLELVTTSNERAEDFVKTKREFFDIATSRAVAALNILLELTAPLVKKGGHIYAYKGSNYKQEIEDSKNALKLLGCKVNKVYEYELPNEMGLHAVIDIMKVNTTPNLYPRMYSKIKNQPL